jgi:DNA-binding MarR family transcriptional regulator
MPQKQPTSIQEEIQQTVPFRSAAQEAVIATQRTADMLTRWADRALAPYDLTAQQYNVLRILRGARGELLPTLVVGERMVQQTPGITRLIDRLEAKGLVRRERCSRDRRVVYCAITEAGLDVLQRADPLAEQLDRAVGEALSDAKLHALADSLARIRAAIE